ncbi:Dephospho-CoA kinase [Coemansia sp. RSA 989]|nr:Dephospho-CoA kinase [Coemansia sp. RSA 1086]KAJ1865782.1 Dephospho-CoA kinase [Coemansia sp. RSA 989]KAJ1875206.1 Dephospho-CoA kinase [Coemansia sp. RSA 990]KAJ2650602.1 Dephospho-CoA kinase [Coemansia sp. RSA 1250]KAJ2671884.1 Dephospho-CoA kinase [Coemansia sp. RSA 1085]
MLVIGLTGGIATGKSTASREFKALGVPVIDADEIARTALEPGQAPYTMVVKHFGASVLSQDQTIDRAKLGGIIFNDTGKRQLLNRCTHPYVRRQIIQQLVSLYVRGHSMCVLDVPLLFESGMDRMCAKTLVVSCSAEQQAERLIQRNQLSTEAAQARIAAQMPMQEKEQRATRVLDNRKSRDELAAQVRQVVRDWRPSALRTLASLAAPLGALVGLVCARASWGLPTLCACSLWMVGSWCLF